MRQKPLRDERGASAVEYGLLVSGIAAVIAVAVYLFGGVTGEMFTGTCDTIRIETGASSGSCS
ncbi:Flp family type IVb pilin [Nocardioides sp. InS609-2]|uniref:Flp family type IVb pilin n=1 Tax=Nocardioides sp. InS609-2 TaxID=2760705 RepID=UPI0020BEAD8D|nr:Flp family type IVb pilin [Nocardioides sp. InS609-2]